ncbi:DUF3916 domain-containing protein [Exiguobacterium profundum]|uniref:DUF3916 domain-containing protein n=1 Tax=Exiguobacterium TaxID=33986 RepID=UPI001BFC267E|nr:MULTISPECIES: DUF3916 domain-containing protein [Exiguobacterium]MCT4798181.1 DUF3916 domain-containing protein [Exiguobacterium profundum]MDT0191562.1 DUF3916 domain-containing protein [Exiguobacterium sp. BG5(2022)]
MRHRKVRGLKRKLSRLQRNIQENHEDFPTEFHNGYWYAKIPVGQTFLMDIQHNAQIKQSLIHTLLNEAKRLAKRRVDERMRVVVLLDFPTLWNSELLIFEDEEGLQTFMRRDSSHQKWIPILHEKTFLNKWVIRSDRDIRVYGFEEWIFDEEGEGREVWMLVQ